MKKYTLKPFTARISDKDIKNLKMIAEKEQVDTSTALRKLLSEAFANWKVKNALEELRKGKMSIGKAAEKAEISIWDMIVLAKKNNIDWIGYTKEDLKRDLKFLKN